MLLHLVIKSIFNIVHRIKRDIGEKHVRNVYNDSATLKETMIAMLVSTFTTTIRATLDNIMIAMLVSTFTTAIRATKIIV